MVVHASGCASLLLYVLLYGVDVGVVDVGVRILALVHVVRGLVSGGEVTNQDQDIAMV